VTARPAICQTVDLERGTRCPGDARRDRASPESESPRAASQPGRSSRWIFAALPDPAEYAAQRRQPHRSVDCAGATIEDLPGLREDMRNPGLPKVAIFGVTSRDQLPSAEPLRSHPAPSFEADTSAFALFENGLDLTRILKLLDPQCIVTIGDMPSFANPLAAPYYICRKWIHMDGAADRRITTPRATRRRCI
jgi:hypothetical protein